jgi:hypothetical protein
METNSMKVVEGEKRNELPSGQIILEFTPDLPKQIEDSKATENITKAYVINEGRTDWQEIPVSEISKQKNATHIKVFTEEREVNKANIGEFGQDKPSNPEITINGQISVQNTNSVNVNNSPQIEVIKKKFNPIDNLRPVRTKEEARERGRNGGLSRSPRKQYMARLTGLKKKGMTDDNYKAIVAWMEEPESAILDMKLLLDSCNRANMNNKEKALITRAYSEVFKCHHGTKTKIEGELSHKVEQISININVPAEIKPFIESGLFGGKEEKKENIEEEKHEQI